MNKAPRMPGVSKALRTIPLVIIVVVGAVVLLEPRRDDLASAFNQIKKEIVHEILGIQVESTTPQYAKDLPVEELQHMLVFTSAALRATAIRAIGARGDVAFVPTLIKMLNDETPLEEMPNRAPLSTAQLAKQALIDILRARIGKEPGNIAVLRPFFEAAARGSVQERKGCIEIIGEIKEPLGVPLLSNIAKADERQELRGAAQAAIIKIFEDRPDSESYELMRGTQLQVIVVMFGVVVVLTGFALRRFFRSGERLFGVLALVPVVLCGGFGSLTTIDHWRGRIDLGSVTRAIDRGDGMALRTMIYQDYTEYPADSGLARLLVRIGSEDVIRMLIRIPAIEPDDFDVLKQMANKKADWILARIIAIRLDSPDVLAFARSNDSGIKLSVVKTLKALAVTNDRTDRVLNVLAEDKDSQIAEKARETLLETREFAQWPYLLHEADSAGPQP